MSDVWPLKKIGEFAKVIGGGTPFRKNATYFGGDIPWITPKDLSGYKYRYIDKGSNNLTKLGLQNSSAKMLPKNSILFSSRAPIGYVAIANDEVCTNQGFRSLVCNEKIALPLYVFYLLKFYASNIEAVASGTTFKEISGSTLSKFILPLPPISIQKKIVSIISAYDELIENNIKSINILENILQNLYQIWFVDFNYQKKKDIKLVESELGKIPQDWEIVKLNKIAKVNRGKSYKGSEICNNGGRPFINLKCINRGGGFRWDGIKRYKGTYKNSHVVTKGNIVIAVTDMTQDRNIVGGVARLGDIGEEISVISLDIVSIIPKDKVGNNYLYSFLRFSNFSSAIKEYANGVNVLHLNPKLIENFKILFPPEHVRKDYEEIVKDIIKKIDVLETSKKTLRKTHTILLSKLLLNEIDVSKLDIKTDNRVT